MSENIYTDEELAKELDEEGIVCFGEYDQWPECAECILRKRCKKFTEAERQVSIRYKGKYTGRGKEKRRERY